MSFNKILKYSIFLIPSILWLAACDYEPTGGNDGGGTVPPSERIAVHSNNRVISYKVSSQEFSDWQLEGMNGTGNDLKIKTATQDIYQKFEDEFDFIMFVINQPNITGFAAGEYRHIKNETQGIGLVQMDDTMEFFSAGKLQGVYALYRASYLNNTTGTVGPAFHELAHRWANWGLNSTYGGHWPNRDNPSLPLANCNVEICDIVGQLNTVTADFAEIELYLMGLIDAGDITPSTPSKDAYDAILADHGARVPDFASSQKDFRMLAVVITDKDLTDAEFDAFDEGVHTFTRTDLAAGSQLLNFKNRTGGRGTLQMDELNLILR